jgi:hypothetical protein
VAFDELLCLLRIGIIPPDIFTSTTIVPVSFILDWGDLTDEEEVRGMSAIDRVLHISLDREGGERPSRSLRPGNKNKFSKTTKTN